MGIAVFNLETRQITFLFLISYFSNFEAPLISIEKEL